MRARRPNQELSRAQTDASSCSVAIAPRLLSRAQAAAYCGLSYSAFSNWVKSGRLPKPISGTARWDLNAINAALDQASGIIVESSLSAFDAWKRQKHARSS